MHRFRTVCHRSAVAIQQSLSTRFMAAAAKSSDGGPATVFDKILNGEIPSTKVFDNDWVYAFRDISAVANSHVLIIPKKRDGLTGLSKATERHAEVLGQLMLAVPEVAKAEGILDSGYRVVINDGEHGCQSVGHLHIHVIGGQQLTWPPGTGAVEGKKEGTMKKEESE